MTTDRTNIKIEKRFSKPDSNSGKKNTPNTKNDLFIGSREEFDLETFCKGKSK